LSTGGSNQVNTFKLDPKPQALTPAPGAAPKAEPTPEPDLTTPTGGDKKAATGSYSEKFTPKGIDGSPILFPGGGGGDRSMGFWKKALNAAGIGGGGDDKSAGDSTGGTG
jgi:hypothetical protein